MTERVRTEGNLAILLRLFFANRLLFQHIFINSITQVLMIDKGQRMQYASGGLAMDDCL